MQTLEECVKSLFQSISTGDKELLTNTQITDTNIVLAQLIADDNKVLKVSHGDLKLINFYIATLVLPKIPYDFKQSQGLKILKILNQKQKQDMPVATKQNQPTAVAATASKPKPNPEENIKPFVDPDAMDLSLEWDDDGVINVFGTTETKSEKEQEKQIKSGNTFMSVVSDAFAVVPDKQAT